MPSVVLIDRNSEDDADDWTDDDGADADVDPDVDYFDKIAARKP